MCNTMKNDNINQQNKLLITESRWKLYECSMYTSFSFSVCENFHNKMFGENTNFNIFQGSAISAVLAIGLHQRKRREKKQTGHQGEENLAGGKKP